MINFPRKERYDISDLRRVMELLRSEDGCPWDRVQTHESIRRDLLEETYEAAEAIDLRDPVLLREELGDVLLQVIFHACIEEEAGRFDFDDVVSDVCAKLLIRHPFVFGEEQAGSTDEVLQSWERVKNQVKGTGSYTETLELVPKTYPALMRAQKVQKRAAAAGFGLKDYAAARADLLSELQELEEARASGEDAAVRDEMGDLLFACVNLARHLGLDAEEALTFSTGKFITRFRRAEALAQEAGIDLAQADDDQRRQWWQLAKQSEK